MKTFTATFTGVEQTIDVTLTGVNAQHQILAVTAQPSDGFGVIRPWLTNHFATVVTVNVPELWQGTVTLVVYNSAQGVVWPAGRSFRLATPICTSSGVIPEVGGRIYAQPLYVPSDVTSVNVRIANRTNSAGVASFTSNIALYTSDGTGQPTGSALAVFNGVTIPGDGTVLSVGPFPVTRGSDGKVVALWSVPQSTSLATMNNDQYGYYVTGTNNVSTNPGGWGVNSGATACVHLELITSKRLLVMIGDSISVGYSAGAGVGFEKTAGNLIAAHKDWALDVEGIVQIGSLGSFANFAGNPFFWDEEKWSSNPDLLINLGTNDIPGQSLSTMQANLATIISHFQSLSSGRIYASTVPPQLAYADAGNVRTGYNSWLLANYAGQGITAVRDRAAKQNVGGLADNTTGTTLFASYDTGDGTHINIAGNAQEQTGWEAIL